MPDRDRCRMAAEICPVVHCRHWFLCGWVYTLYTIVIDLGYEWLRLGRRRRPLSLPGIASADVKNTISLGLGDLDIQGQAKRVLANGRGESLSDQGARPKQIGARI